MAPAHRALAFVFVGASLAARPAEPLSSPARSADGPTVPTTKAAAEAVFPSSSSSSDDDDDLVREAKERLRDRDADGAFASLAAAYDRDPNGKGLQGLFESCLRLRIDLADERLRRGTPGDDDAAAADAVVAAAQDRFGLSSLLIDQERYEEASDLLRRIVSDLEAEEGSGDDVGRRRRGGSQSSSSSSSLLERSAAMLHRTNAACCRWDDYEEDGRKLSVALDRFVAERKHDDSSAAAVPALHPFEALKFPCVSLRLATEVARSYGRRASINVDETAIADDDSRDAEEREIEARTASVDTDAKLFPSSSSSSSRRVLKIGYLSPDFTSVHPLAFLMQHVFRRHDKSKFSVHLYSLSEDDGGDEVSAIRSGSDSYTVLPSGGLTPRDLAERIRRDSLDVMIDLCGYAGSSVVAEMMATKLCAPIQISYMGFPGGSGAGSSYVDYAIVDRIVVPDRLRKHYDENLIYMPHCYFVNSHATCVASGTLLNDDDEQRASIRERYDLPKDAFVYACHSRPDKIDPSTYRSWLRALFRVHTSGVHAVLWLLRSGPEMESNLRHLARREFGLGDDALVFCDVASRDVHLNRLGCADLFLDTPAYNAHTLGCDALFVGVPMVSLLRPPSDSDGSTSGEERIVDGRVPTEKWASRVGASLLRSAGLRDFVCPTVAEYERIMERCAVDGRWYGTVRDRLVASRTKCPLFDTERWVRNLELALRDVVASRSDGKRGRDFARGRRTRQDVFVVDDDP